MSKSRTVVCDAQREYHDKVDRSWQAFVRGLITLSEHEHNARIYSARYFETLHRYVKGV